MPNAQPISPPAPRVDRREGRIERRRRAVPVDHERRSRSSDRRSVSAEWLQRCRDEIVAIMRAKGDSQQAEDIAQQAILDALTWIARNPSGGVAVPWAWLLRIARNAAWRESAWSRLRKPSQSADAVCRQGWYTDPGLEALEYADLAQVALAWLPPAVREVVILVACNGCTCGEAAARAGVSRSHACKLMAHGRHLARRRQAEWGMDGPE
jgi:DNA-directed RNA polymerase specialized sigma24 family protein